MRSFLLFTLLLLLSWPILQLAKADFIADLVESPNSATSSNMRGFNGAAFTATGLSLTGGNQYATITGSNPVWPGPPYRLTLSLSLSTVSTCSCPLLELIGTGGNLIQIDRRNPTNAIQFLIKANGVVLIDTTTTVQSGVIIPSDSTPTTITIDVTSTTVTITNQLGQQWGPISLSGGVPTAFTSDISQFAVTLGNRNNNGMLGTINQFQIVGLAGASGDPAFIGFHGQSFQVHGYPDQWFNIISSSTLSANAKFSFLDEAASTCNYNNTQCWSHPGTYMSEFGITLVDRESNSTLLLSLNSGSHSQGLHASVTYMHKVLPNMEMNTDDDDDDDKSESIRLHSRNDHIITIGERINIGLVMINRPAYDIITVSDNIFTLEIVNSDWFFNIKSLLHHRIIQAGYPLVDMRKQGQKNISQAYPKFNIHGLIGQTWRNIIYPSGRLYEGHVADYVCSSRFAHDSVFNMQ